jgi:LuxR family transcriptional regulator, maltose regulon positive regulatory protein
VLLKKAILQQIYLMPVLVITRKGDIDQLPLTAREREILILVGEGKMQKQIAAQLGISLETVKKHIRNSYKKLGAHNKLEALRKAKII